jgi:hypothetical protein
MTDLKAKHERELADHAMQIASLGSLGDIPGLTPWLIHSPFRGYDHVAFSLEDITQFVAWAKENCVEIHAIEGKYKTLWPFIPETRDYVDADIVDTGDVVVRYSTISNLHKIICFTKTHKISFKIKKHIPDLQPTQIVKRYAPRYYGAQRIDGWRRPNLHKTYLRLSVDKQSADLETLLNWEQFESYFIGV